MPSAKRGQSATEFLLTYGWAFLILTLVIAAFYIFLAAPQQIAPSICSLSNGGSCQDIVVSSSNSITRVAFLLTNTQSFPVAYPSVALNASVLGSRTLACVPTLVLPGADIICNETTHSGNLAQGALVSGSFKLDYLPCPSANVLSCGSSGHENFIGDFNAHSSALLSPISLTILLTAQNSTQIADGQKDELKANVMLLGTPIQGVTVNFTSNTPTANVIPFLSTTNSNGDAISYIWSNFTGNVLVSAIFANDISNTIVDFSSSS